jgi:hypothetical protein
MGRGPAAAVDALSAAVGAQPGRADLWSELATALVAAGRGPEAWDAAVRAVELAPRSAASHRAIGSVAAALGDTAQADAAYRHAARLDPAGAPDSGGGRHDAAYGQAGVLDPGGPPDSGGGRHDAAYGPAALLDPAGAPDSGGGRHDAAYGPAALLDPGGATAAGGGRHDAAYGQAGVLDPGGPPDSGGGRHASDRADALAAWMADQIAGAGRAAPGAAVPEANGSRHAAPDDSPSGRHGVPSQPGGDPGRPLAPRPPTGRRRAPEDTESAPQPSGGRRRAPEDGPPTATWMTAPAAAADGGPPTAVWPVGTAAASGGAVADVGRPGAAGLPGWLGPSAPRDRAAPTGATRISDPEAWRRGLIRVVRIEWLVGIACFLGLAYARTAPYTAGLLAGALVVVGAYGRVRWRPLVRLRPPEPDRIPTYASVAGVATSVVIIPAAMAGALTLARLAAAAAVTSATVAAVLLARLVGRDVTP